MKDKSSSKKLTMMAEHIKVIKEAGVTFLASNEKIIVSIKNFLFAGDNKKNPGRFQTNPPQ